MIPLIEKKRDGGEHSAEELQWLMQQVVAGSVPDYQLAAWLMAVVCRGMTATETADLTLAMASSGEMLDLGDLGGQVVDKHSTGGVGDKTTLVVGPLAAACGLVVAKMSGRGLGHTGGTLDKLESIPGLSVDLDVERFRRQAKAVGLVIAGQSARLAPADGKLYSLRDVTGTVESLPLLAASIMSKKLAAGAGSIVLDVKSGEGAFLTDYRDAYALADTMVQIGHHAGRRMRAVLSSMDQPLGLAIGNALEVAEAIDTLRGDGPDDLTTLAIELTAHLIELASSGVDHEAALAQAREALFGWRGLERFAAMIEAQGGDPRVVDDPGGLPVASYQLVVTSAEEGVIQGVHARQLADTCVRLGAGRLKKGDSIDPAVGVVLRVKTGERVARGDELAVVHARDEATARRAAFEVLAAFQIGDSMKAAPPLIREVIGED